MGDKGRCVRVCVCTCVYLCSPRFGIDRRIVLPIVRQTSLMQVAAEKDCSHRRVLDVQFYGWQRQLDRSYHRFVLLGVLESSAESASDGDWIDLCSFMYLLANGVGIL